MDYEEIVCVYLNLKFLVFKNVEKSDNCLSDDFLISIASPNEIEVEDNRKEYFIKKFHTTLKNKKKNEFECIYSGTLSEVANFLYQHISLFIEIKNLENEGIPEEDHIKLQKGDSRKGFAKNKIHLLRSVDMDELHFEEDRIYFKCLFNDLINDFEFSENKKFENISNFYITNELVFSICLKLEEQLLEKKDIEKTRLENYTNIDRYDYKYKNLLSIFDLNRLFYVYFNFSNYNEQFFLDNNIEITVGDMIQNLSSKVSSIDYEFQKRYNTTEPSLYNISAMKKDIMDSSMNFNTGCHFSLILVDNLLELYDYFCMNEVFITCNKIQLNVDKEIFSNISKNKEDWVQYKNFKQITFNLNTLPHRNHSIHLNFNVSIICIEMNPMIQQSDSNFISLSLSHSTPTTFSYEVVHHPVDVPGYHFFPNDNGNVDINHSESVNKPMGRSCVLPHKEINKTKELLRRTHMKCNLFLSVKGCNILELSNIYAEKKKKSKNTFFIKIESSLSSDSFTSPDYIFQEDTQIELKNCYIDFNLDTKNENLFEYCINKFVFFELSLRESEEKEEASTITIGSGELHLKTIITELRKVLEEKTIQNYFKYSILVPLHLSVFKEKYLTSELVVEIFLQMKEAEPESPILPNIKEKEKEIIEPMKVMRTLHEESVIKVESKTVGSSMIPSNLYEFKLWKEQEQEKMKEELKKKEEHFIKKLSKKFEMLEKERKSEFETKKNQLKEIVLQVKEKQINIMNHNNTLQLRDKELNEEIQNIQTKLKKIKHAYEKAFHQCKEKLRTNCLSESILKENNELKKSYKEAIQENKCLKKEKEELNSELRKYNNKENVIISTTYFKKIKDELQELKEMKVRMNSINNVNKEIKDNDNTALKEESLELWNSYLKTIHKNRKKMSELISSFIIQLEEIYDLTHDEILEEKFQSILKDINIMKLLVNKELKEEALIKDKKTTTRSMFIEKYQIEDNKELVDITTSDSSSCIPSAIKNEYHINLNKKKQSLIGRKVGYTKHQKKTNAYPIDSKGENNEMNYSKQRNKDPVKTAEKKQINKPNVNANKNTNLKNIEALKNEINRLVKTGIYNKDDQIIINMKKKLKNLTNT